MIEVNTTVLLDKARAKPKSQSLMAPRCQPQRHINNTIAQESLQVWSDGVHARLPDEDVLGFHVTVDDPVRV